jgi:7-carboxy-7-deazaguanine synthase
MTSTAALGTAPVRRLWIAETFADTIQGEGPSAGTPAMFIRTSGCNLECRPWCDTPYTWDRARFDLPAERTRRSVAELAAWAAARPEPLVVLTGGEPLMQQRALIPLANALVAIGKRVEIETNGTYAPATELTCLGVHYNVSPKLANAGMPSSRTIRPGALAAFAAAPNRVFKFVVCDPSDLDQVDALVTQCGLTQVWVMPEGTTPRAVTDGMKALVPAVVERGYRISPRLHVVMWGDQRGR